MPMYEYKCEDCGTVTVQTLSLDDYSNSKMTPVCLNEIEDKNGLPKPCGGHTRRVFSPPAISIK